MYFLPELHLVQSLEEFPLQVKHSSAQRLQV